MFRRVLSPALVFALVLLGMPVGAAPALALDSPANGTIQITTVGTPYTQDFGSLATTGTSNSLPVGWALSESGSGTANDGRYTAGTGSSQTGDTYSFGTTSSSERAFGTLLSGSLTPIIGASFTNATGVAIPRIDISYTGEQWRTGAAGRTDRLDFQYSLDATSLTTGAWTHIDALDFSSVAVTTVGAVNGNLAANRQTVAGSILASLAPGATFWIRWTDFNPAGSDDGLAIDDLSLTLQVADTAPSVAATSPAAGAVGVARNANISVTFSEPVAATGAWAAIACTATGAHAATITGSGAAYTIDPAGDFAASETCTVTVYASQVRDLDTNDPPDNMTGDASWSFTIDNAEQCGDAATFISAVQGSGLATPISGTVVSIEGVVVGDYQEAGQLGGFYVQEEDGDADGDAATSEGIFVFNTSNAVAAGQRVRVTGTASEFFDLTQLSSVSRVLICPAGGPVTPTTITLPVASVSTFERYEGMLVSFADTLTATETYTLGRFGEVRLSANGRLFTPTAVTTPGAPAIAQAELNQRSSFVLDDGNGQQNIDPTVHPVGGLSATNTLRSGYTVDGLTGVFDFRFGAYRLQPVGPVAFAVSNPRTTAPAAVGGNTKVASFNVLNFFNGDGQGGGFPTARGATTPFELGRQKAKEVSALSAINADVVGLMEIENDSGPYSALAELVAALNDKMGAGTYAYIDSGVIGTDAIKVALIYKPAAVMPSGDYALLTSSVDPRFIDTRNRPALAQTFIRKDSAGKFTVVVNHLKSKGSECAGDPDLGDGQGNCNGTRTQAAAALADWLATDPTGSRDTDVLIMGDLNAYTFEDPITTLESAGYTNLARRYNGLSAYSYVFDGQAGYLDHALATATLASQATGLVDWHINADEPIVLDYNVEFKTPNQVNTFYDAGPFRSSDHDPVIIGLQLTGDLGSLCEMTRALVTNHGVATSLCQKLEAAAAAAARGNGVAADNMLDAYTNEVDAIRGKRLSDVDADTLIAIAQTL